MNRREYYDQIQDRVWEAVERMEQEESLYINLQYEISTALNNLLNDSGSTLPNNNTVHAGQGERIESSV